MMDVNPSRLCQKARFILLGDQASPSPISNDQKSLKTRWERFTAPIVKVDIEHAITRTEFEFFWKFAVVHDIQTIENIVFGLHGPHEHANYDSENGTYIFCRHEGILHQEWKRFFVFDCVEPQEGGQ